jgi:hypothetical protein
MVDPRAMAVKGEARPGGARVGALLSPSAPRPLTVRASDTPMDTISAAR